MKKSHLLWKILVVVMIVSAMMVSVIACDGDGGTTGGGGGTTGGGGTGGGGHKHTDADNNYFCDDCGEMIPHDHVDADGNLVCDLCSSVMAQSATNVTSLFAALDDVVNSLKTMGEVSTMGGNIDLGINFAQGDTEKEITLGLDFGLELREIMDDQVSAGSFNAFGFTVDVDEVRQFGIWYADQGSEDQNYIYAQFGALGAAGSEVISFKAPSLAEIFNNYPVYVNENIETLLDEATGGSDSVLSDLAGSYATLIGGLLPVVQTTSGNITTYTIALTDTLFNASMPEPSLNSMVESLLSGDEIDAALSPILAALGVAVDGGNYLEILDGLLPPVSLSISIGKTGDVATSLGLGVDIAGEKMSIPVVESAAGEEPTILESALAGMIVNGEAVLVEDFEDIALDITLGYKFGDNSNGDVFNTINEAITDVLAEFEANEVTPLDISLLNFAVDTTLTLGIDDNPATDYNLQLAVDLDPSVIAEGNLLTTAYVIDGEGNGVYVDANKNGQYDAGEEKTVVALNVATGANAYDAILGMINSLYLKIGPVDDPTEGLSVNLTSKAVGEDGAVSDFTVQLKGAGWIADLLSGFGVNLGDMEGFIRGLNDGPLDLAGDLVRPTVSNMLSGLVKGVSFTTPSDWVAEAAAPAGDTTGDTAGDTTGDTATDSEDSGFDIGALIDTIMGYVDLFTFDTSVADQIGIATNGEADFAGTKVSFDATGAVLKDAQGKVNGVQLSLSNDGIVIKGADSVNTTVKLTKPLKIGGDDNLFSVEVTVSQTGTDKPLNLTLGLDLNGIGYGIAPNAPGAITDFSALFQGSNMAVAK